MRRAVRAVVGGSPCPGVFLVRLSGRFDLETGARLLRVIDSRLVAGPTGHPTTGLLLVDLAEVTSLGAGVIATLRHARHACTCRSVRLALTGADRPLPPASPRDRAELIRHLRFPTVAVALEAWAARPRPVPGAVERR